MAGISSIICLLCEWCLLLKYNGWISFLLSGGWWWWVFLSPPPFLLPTQTSVYLSSFYCHYYSAILHPRIFLVSPNLLSAIHYIYPLTLSYLYGCPFFPSSSTYQSINIIPTLGSCLLSFASPQLVIPLSSIQIPSSPLLLLLPSHFKMWTAM